MSKNLYSVLGINKSSNKEDIKKAYRKLAMQYHPDRNKGDKNAEEKFKEVNEAYSTLSDAKKKQQYDTFGSTSQSNPFGGQSQGSYSGGGFDDIFSGFGGAGSSKTSGATFDFSDLFGNGGGFDRGNYNQTSTKEKKKEETLDIENIYEAPVFDIILGCSIEVKGYFGDKVKLKIPKGSKPGTKFRVKGLGKKSSNKVGNLIVELKAKMPKNISEVDIQLLQRIAENVGY